MQRKLIKRLLLNPADQKTNNNNKDKTKRHFDGGNKFQSRAAQRKGKTKKLVHKYSL